MGPGKLTLIAQCSAVCASLAGAPAVDAAGTFDGDWSVTLTCPKADGASGYTYRFPAEIQENVLHGERGARDAGGWLTLDGKLEPDGSGTLVAQGLATSTPHAIGRMDKPSPYTYEVSTQFDATSGSGSRTGMRKCGFVFVKD
ncbi:hypothetical protein [Paraburkholderia lycopersici]|uniref:Uncharacterized protein n=1 Tax=Paraburkholderia lycopersici TaxID=416944 RepID=A0A1G6PIB6_9BURK|nr:hypothetical protein [Paraburkholderia lycopersici]SDC79893.1 hypothetical protein SAMN05421548_110159 [Paraburkholderia lycopersici]